MNFSSPWIGIQSRSPVIKYWFFTDPVGMAAWSEWVDSASGAFLPGQHSDATHFPESNNHGTPVRSSGTGTWDLLKTLQSQVTLNFWQTREEELPAPMQVFLSFTYKLFLENKFLKRKKRRPNIHTALGMAGWCSWASPRCVASAAGGSRVY